MTNALPQAVATALLTADPKTLMEIIMACRKLIGEPRAFNHANMLSVYALDAMVTTLAKDADAKHKATGRSQVTLEGPDDYVLALALEDVIKKFMKTHVIE